MQHYLLHCPHHPPEPRPGGRPSPQVPPTALCRVGLLLLLPLLLLHLLLFFPPLLGLFAYS